MSKKLTHKSYLQMVKEFNDLLKKHKIDKSEYITPSSNILDYNVNDVVEGKEYIDILICPICYNILKDPISCNYTEKSHSFCRNCIVQCLKLNDKCPMCKQTFKFSTNKKIKELLPKLKFKCKYAEEGCQKILDYSYYFFHLEKCEFKENLYECQVEKYNYKNKTFQKCNYEGTFKKIMKHFKTCAFLEYKCLFCNNNFLQINFKEHFSSGCKIMFHTDEELIYIGQHDSNFHKKGIGKKFNKDDGTLVYEGEFKANNVNGFGIYYMHNGLFYEGEWKNNLSEGFGQIIKNGNLQYKGEFKKGKKHGIGLEINDNAIYEGEFKNNSCEGYGIAIFFNDCDIQRYEGEWKDDQFDGYGIAYYKDGSIYNGKFKEDLKYGFGIYYINNKEYYVGQFKDDLYEGYGKIYYFDSKRKIKGSFKKDVPEGFGIEYLSNGDTIEGYWKNGKLDEFAFLYTIKGETFIKYYVEDNEIFSTKIN